MNKTNTSFQIKCLNINFHHRSVEEKNIDLFFFKINKLYDMLFSNLLECKETGFLHFYTKHLDWKMNVHNKLNDSLLNNTTVLDCLKILCKNHWKVPETDILSPLWLFKDQDISHYQFQKVAVTIRASLKNWDDIDGLIHKKSWIGGKKLQTSLPIEEVLKILQECQATPKIMEKFFHFVDLRKRLNLAKNLHCYPVVINILVSQGDRTALLEYQASLRSQSEEYFYAEKVLYNPATKWKN